MRRFFEQFNAFMQGRYGMDTLNRFLIGLCLVIWFASLFVFNLYARLIITAVQMCFLGWMIFRALSRNFTMRSAENRAFCKAYNPVKNKVKFTWRKFRDRKNYRYLKCPVCKSQLRVKNQKGKHRVRCPRCKSEFDKTIR